MLLLQEQQFQSVKEENTRLDAAAERERAALNRKVCCMRAEEAGLLILLACRTHKSDTQIGCSLMHSSRFAKPFSWPCCTQRLLKQAKARFM